MKNVTAKTEIACAASANNWKVMFEGGAIRLVRGEQHAYVSFAGGERMGGAYEIFGDWDNPDRVVDFPRPARANVLRYLRAEGMVEQKVS